MPSIESDLPDFSTRIKELRESIIKSDPSKYKFVSYAEAHDQSPSILDFIAYDPAIQLYMACSE